MKSRKTYPAPRRQTKSEESIPVQGNLIPNEFYINRIISYCDEVSRRRKEKREAI